MLKQHLPIFAAVAACCVAGSSWMIVQDAGQPTDARNSVAELSEPAPSDLAGVSLSLQNPTEIAEAPQRTEAHQLQHGPVAVAQYKTLVSQSPSTVPSASQRVAVVTPNHIWPTASVRRRTSHLAHGHSLPPAENEPEPSVAVVNRGPAGQAASGRMPADRLVSSANLLLALDAGVKTPVALLEDSEESRPLSVEQAGAKNRIADDFSREVGEAATKPRAGAADIEDVWLDAQARADERYRLLFGDAEYQNQIVRAAQEALAGQ